MNLIGEGIKRPRLGQSGSQEVDRDGDMASDDPA